MSIQHTGTPVRGERRPMVAAAEHRLGGRLVAYAAFGLSFAFATALVLGLV